MLPFHETGGPRLFLEVTEDNRERVLLRERLLEIEKLTTMGMMAAGTAHHLNTPLAAMLLRVQMMRERDREGGASSELTRLEASISFCQQFVDRLLQFSRRSPARKQPEEVEPLIRGVVSFLTPAVMAKRARVAVEPDSTSKQRVLADRNLIEAMFAVLITNALDAINPEGSITIRCSNPSPEWIEVRITDDGCGIPPADLPRVFEPFFTTKGPGKGTGLGLSIAQTIVLEHGGEIHIDSQAGCGTTAIVRLPALSVPQRQGHPA